MKPRLLDLYSGAGGSAKGYQLAGFHVTGVDNQPQPRYVGDEFIQADALEYLERHGKDFDAIHASPPCQGYSIMRNLPWNRDKEYPLLILPTLELLEATGRPYVLENVMGARNGAKGLKKRGLQAHGLQAGYLCGAMFGLPFYRHRLFATNWFWLAPGHPKHTLNLHPRSERAVYGGAVKGLPGGAAGLDVKPKDPFHDEAGKSLVGPGNLGKGAGLARWQERGGAIYGNSTFRGFVADPRRHEHNGETFSQHAGKGWRLAAEAMGIDWMKREELTQAIPPCYTEYIGAHLLQALRGGDRGLTRVTGW